MTTTIEFRYGCQWKPSIDRAKDLQGVTRAVPPDALVLEMPQRTILQSYTLGLPTSGRWIEVRKDLRADTRFLKPRDVVIQLDAESRRAGKGPILTPCDACDRPVIARPRDTCCGESGHQACCAPWQHTNLSATELADLCRDLERSGYPVQR